MEVGSLLFGFAVGVGVMSIVHFVFSAKEHAFYMEKLSRLREKYDDISSVLDERNKQLIECIDASKGLVKQVSKIVGRSHK